jgi:peptide-methionine (R)-S-oxide reductase
MNRRSLLQALCAIGAAPLLPACARSADFVDPGAVAPDISRLTKPDSEWRDQVSADAYRVLFEDATEPPGSSPLDREKRDGSFICAACYLPLFDSASKFDSGTGWPSFTRPIAGHVETSRDFKLLWPRTEYHCIRCGGHQGHVFDDGPPPRHERWCNNGVALKFIPRGDTLPALRN